MNVISVRDTRRLLWLLTRYHIGVSERNEAGEPTRTLFTVQEAADQLGISAHTLRDAIKRGVVQVEHINPRLNMLTLDEIERYRRERLGKRGGYRHKAAPTGDDKRRVPGGLTDVGS